MVSRRFGPVLAALALLAYMLRKEYMRGCGESRVLSITGILPRIPCYDGNAKASSGVLKSGKKAVQLWVTVPGQTGSERILPRKGILDTCRAGRNVTV